MAYKPLKKVNRWLMSAIIIVLLFVAFLIFNEAWLPDKTQGLTLIGLVFVLFYVMNKIER